MTVPKELRLTRPGGQVAVPLAFLSKSPLPRLTTADAAGKALCVLEAPVNSYYALEFLTAMVPPWVRSQPAVFAAVENVLRKLVTSPFGHSTRILELTLRQLLLNAGKGRARLSDEEAMELAAFQSMAKNLGSRFIFMVEMDASSMGARTILKYGVDQATPRTEKGLTKRVTFKVEVPDLGWAASLHVEVLLPSGIVLERLELEDTLLGGNKSGGLEIKARGRREQCTAGHVSLRPSTRLSSGHFWVTVVPARQGLHEFSAMAIIFVSLTVCLGWVMRSFSESILNGATIPSNTVSLLLIGPALFISWISRTPEHEIVAKVQRPLQIALMLSAGVLLILAGLASVPVMVPVWKVAWVVLSVFQAIALLTLLVYSTDLLRRFRRNWARLKKSLDAAVAKRRLETEER
ncbi:MAG: hypothetical protein ABIN10_12170 [Specibacter sp.]